MTTTPIARSGALLGLLRDASASPSHKSDLRRQARSLALTVVGALAVLAAWSALAPLAGAVVAPAQLRVEYKRKTVQHQEGGTVREVLVRDGQAVHAGDPLIIIRDLRQDAELSLLQDQWYAASARAARVGAESRFEAHFEAPPVLSSDAAAAPSIARESVLFATRKQALDQQVALLQVQSQQAQAQALALQAQAEATRASGTLSEEELSINEALVSQGFINRTRMIGLQRVAADYKARAEQVRSELALARQHVAELQSREAQLRLTYQSQANDELKDAAARVRELDQRLRPSRDQADRLTVRAPVDGTVMSLRVAAPGAIVAPREPLLDIVPQHEKLVVDARIEPQDIEHVAVGGLADVRLTSADARNAPLLPARVSFVSADRVSEPASGKSWFEVTVEVDAAALRGHPSAMRLQAGMPAEVFVTTGSRTLLEYLGKPLRMFWFRALREPG